MTAQNSRAQFSLSFEHRDDYLYAYVTGQHDSYEISKRYWQEIARELKGTQYRRLLVDEDIIEAASMGDVFQLVSELVGMGFAGIRIAFYDRQITHTDLNDFGALVASNRGLDGLAFNDIEKAKEWLLTDAR